LDDISLVECFAWTEAEFAQKMSGSAIYRIGYKQWLRNIAVGLGNATSSPEIINALKARENDDSELLREHVSWALAQHLK
jgi:epoxyqueuosine reductase